MVDLNDCLDDSGAGWTLGDAMAINDLGQIVGNGWHEGTIHAFLLTPVPEPSTFVLLGLGLLGFGFAWRQQKQFLLRWAAK
jgi:hypothetical protein